MSKILTICNQKGGTSKSTSVVNLGAALRLMGKKVLIVDMDPQGDASTYLGFDDENADTISQMIERFIRGEQINLHDIIQESEKNGGVEYIPADLSLAGAEMYLVSVMSRETVLRRLLSTIRDEYDYILIDCQPSLGVLVLNALVAADGAIIPAQTQEFSRKALKAITDIIGQVQATINPNLKLLGILPTMVDNTAMSKDTRKVFEDNYGELVFPMNISRSVTAAYSSKTSYKKSIWIRLSLFQTQRILQGENREAFVCTRILSQKQRGISSSTANFFAAKC